MQKIGVAGVGAAGRVVAQALIDGKIDGMQLHAISEVREVTDFPVPCLDFDALAEACDIVVECLPPSEVPALVPSVLKRGKTLILITSSVLLSYPEWTAQANENGAKIIVPSGALAGMDGVRALASVGIISSKIRSTKPPRALEGAPYILSEKIDLGSITEKQMIFSGNALAASKAFPANVNVSATLSLAGIGPEKTMVEVWADPDAKGNKHEISVDSAFSTLNMSIENLPDPSNPKTSGLTAHSIIACLQRIACGMSIG